MSDVVTKILYDVTQAVTQLDKLNKKVEKSEKKAKKAFDTKSINNYDKRLKKLAYTLGGTDFTAKGLFITLGGSAAVLGAAAGAVGALVAQMIDLDGIMKDSIKSIEGFNEATDTIQDMREALSTLGDVAVNRDIRLAQRAVKLDQAENARQQNLVEQARDLARKRLDIVKDELDRRDDLLSKSLKKEEDLRKRLERRTTEDPAAGFSGPVGKKALDLGAAARQAAFAGDLDKAEALEDAAREAGEEAGNHALFLRDQSATHDAINAAIERELSKQEQQSAKYADQVDEAQAVAQQLDAVIERENERLVVLRQQSRELGAQQKILRVGAREAKEQQQADTGARTFENNARDFSNNVKNGGETFKETVKGAASEFKRFFSGEVQRREFLADSERAGASAANIEKILGRVTRGEGVTAADLEGLRGDFGNLTNIIAKLQFARSENRLTTSQDRLLSRLERLQESALGALEGASQFRDVRGDQDFIKVGIEGFTADEIRGLRDAMIENTKALREPSKGTKATAALDQAAATSTGAPQQLAASGPATVNVNATVKGGLIDGETAREITTLIRKELRKQTTQNVA